MVGFYTYNFFHKIEREDTLNISLQLFWFLLHELKTKIIIKNYYIVNENDSFRNLIVGPREGPGNSGPMRDKKAIRDRSIFQAIPWPRRYSIVYEERRTIFRSGKQLRFCE